MTTNLERGFSPEHQAAFDVTCAIDDLYEIAKQSDGVMKIAIMSVISQLNEAKRNLPELTFD